MKHFESEHSRLVIFDQISSERDRQDELHPLFQPDHANRLAVLTEEVGEVAKGIQDKDVANLREELIQVAAVAIRWIEQLDKEAHPSP